MVNESTLNDLRAEIKQLEIEKSRIDGNLRALNTTLRHFENSGGSVSTGEHPGGLRAGMEQPAQRTANDLRNAIHDILAAAGPLHRREIHDRLVDMGVYIGGNNPINNVGAHLSVDHRFTNVGKGVWALVEQPDIFTAPTHSGSRADAVYKILSAERPLHRQDIYERLEKMGVHIGGQSPVNNVSGTLTNDSRFVNVGKGMWTLANQTDVLQQVPDQGMQDAIHAVLLDADGPLHRREICDRLVKMGVRAEGPNTLRNVSSCLTRSSRFRSDGDGHWDLAERDSVEQLEEPYQGDEDEEDSVPW